MGLNWSGISRKSWMGKVVRLPLRLLPAAMKMPILQGPLKGKKWIVGSSTHGCWLGSYELDKQRLFEATVTRGSVVFDLGGNVGFYTLLASELVGPEGKVFVFEPVPRNLVFLKEHIRLNNCRNVTVIEAAVSDKGGTISFDEGPGNSMGHMAPGGSLQVRAIALDELVSSRGIPPPNYLKIDIEGAEMLALSGARSILKSHPAIFLSTHGDAVREECLHFLKSTGYRVDPIDSADIELATEFVATIKAG